jgi:dephospho-CoA kinase
MLVVGLTGSIAMGKTTAAAHLRSRGVPVFEADQVVHEIYRKEAVTLIEAAFPGCTDAGGVNRVLLSEALQRDPSSFKRLEAIVHPLVREREKRFLDEAHDAGVPVAVLDVPLLYETGLEAMLDAVIVVSASAQAQRERALKRPGMTPEKLDQILARQLPDAEKRRRAHFIVDTNGPPGPSLQQLDAILGAMQGRRAQAYTRFWS